MTETDLAHHGLTKSIITSFYEVYNGLGFGFLETHYATALERELREELAIEAEVGTLKMASTHSYGETGIVILFYEVQFWKGEPKKVHHMELKWVLPKDLHTLDIPDANRKILPRLIALLK